MQKPYSDFSSGRFSHLAGWGLMTFRGCTKLIAPKDGACCVNLHACQKTNAWYQWKSLLSLRL